MGAGKAWGLAVNEKGGADQRLAVSPITGFCPGSIIRFLARESRELPAP
jgi:hypothetical protein